MSSNPRRTHRKRVSALRLSSDTTSTLPEYITVGGWNREDDLDQPPDYPDSAEEADEDTDSEGSPASIYVPPLPLSPSAPSPRRQRRFMHRRRQSTNSNDPYLDSLLARSVHALEMSNTLLQSSMSTQTSLSSILTADSAADEVLETSARGLSMRIHGGDRQARWAKDLAEISQGVDGLFNEGRPVASPSTAEPSLSCSVPSSSPPLQLYRQRRRPSLLELSHTSEPRPHLHISYGDRSDLVSPPPRALTQYVASTYDPDAITLPSTLGLRVPSSLHAGADRRPSVEPCNLHATLSSPQLTDRPLEPCTPAYNMLSSFVTRAPSSGSSTPSSSIASVTAPITSFLSNSRRSSRNTSTSTERSDTRSSSSPGIKKSKLPDTTRVDSHDRSSRSLTPKQLLTALPHRPMTPPTEESSSSDTCTTKRTILSLRKILDEQPAPLPPEPPNGRHLRPPAFLPRTPAPVAEAETSTATASVSRLFTKAKHSSSTRPPSPPRVSAMKQPSPAGSHGSTPSPSPTVLSIPDLLGGGVGRVLGGSTPSSSSGRSTPKRISFAELPESYSGTRPGGGSAKFREKKGRRGKEKGNRKGSEEEGAQGGWWTGWLVSTGTGGLGAGGFGAGAARHEERMEDRLSRSWGGRMAGGGVGSGLDDWAM